MAWPSQVGRYRITGELGRGAMGVVLRGIDPALERPVAIKLIAARAHSGVTSEEMEARFLREARVAARISHAGIVTVYDAGREGSSLFLVMELIEGESLGDKLARGEYPEPAVALELVAKVAEALGAAHALGVIHRDVKPSNVMITTDGRVKVADFGVAKAIGEDTNLTRTGTVVGSPAYMAPEQVRGQQLDGRSDLFSLGVVLYELLLHRKPFPSETVTTLIYQILHEDPLASPDISRALGDDVAVLLRRCLAKTPEERFPDGAALAAATRVVASRLVQSTIAGPHATGDRVVAPTAASSGTPFTGTPSRASHPAQPVPVALSTPTGTVQATPGPVGATRTASGLAAVSDAASATRTTGTPAAAPVPALGATGAVAPETPQVDVHATTPTRQIGMAPGGPPLQPATPVSVAPIQPKPTHHLAIGGALAVIGLLLLGAAAFVVVKALRQRSDQVAVLATPPPGATPMALALESPTPVPLVPTPLPTFTPSAAPMPTTPTPVSEWWPTVPPATVATADPGAASRAVATRAPLVVPTLVPTLAPATPTPRPTEPPIAATFKCQKGVTFSLSPDSATITMDGTTIGTADDWDDMGGGKVFEFSGPGVHYALISLAGYHAVWVKIVVDPSASDEIADVDTDLKKDKKKKSDTKP